MGAALLCACSGKVRGVERGDARRGGPPSVTDAASSAGSGGAANESGAGGGGGAAQAVCSGQTFGDVGLPADLYVLLDTSRGMSEVGPDAGPSEWTAVTHALELAAQFAEQRQKVLAENLANIDTPNYHSQRLDPAAFQASLRKALEGVEQTGARRLVLRDNAQFSTGPDGQIQARPAREPAPNVLFHDGTNARLEEVLGDVAKNSLSYDLATSLLRGRYEGLMRAIRGRVT